MSTLPTVLMGYGTLYLMSNITGDRQAARSDRDLATVTFTHRQAVSELVESKFIQVWKAIYCMLLVVHIACYDSVLAIISQSLIII